MHMLIIKWTIITFSIYDPIFQINVYLFQFDYNAFRQRIPELSGTVSILEIISSGWINLYDEEGLCPSKTTIYVKDSDPQDKRSQ